MKRGRPRFESVHPEVITLLGRKTDNDIAAQFGVTPTTVSKARQRLGIPWAHPAAIAAAVAKAEDELVIVASRMLPDGKVQLLNGHGGVRVYHKDALDHRVTMAGEPPCFRSWPEAEDHLHDGWQPGRAGPFRQCLIPLPLARQVFPTAEFGQPFEVS